MKEKQSEEPQKMSDFSVLYAELEHRRTKNRSTENVFISFDSGDAIII